MYSAFENEFELIPELEMVLNNEYYLEYDVLDPQISTGTRSSKEYIRWLQVSLNSILKLKPALKITGILDGNTKDALKLFQKKFKIIPQKTVPDEKTEAALIRAGASSP